VDEATGRKLNGEINGAKSGKGVVSKVLLFGKEMGGRANYSAQAMTVELNSNFLQIR